MINENLYYQLELTARRIKHYGQSQLNYYGIDITIEQWLVLKQVHEKQGITQTEIIRILIKDKPTISRMVKSLMQKNLISRNHSSLDLRSHALFTTNKGEELIKKLTPIIKEIRSKGLGPLTDLEKGELNKTLFKIRNNLGY
ncbi:MAG: MarR family transcriptional regulator [Bacteroidota bacterium]